MESQISGISEALPGRLIVREFMRSIIPDKGVGALNEDAILTSAGALEKIPVCRVNSLMKAVDELHLNGIHVFASEMKADKKVFDCDFKIPAHYFGQ